MHYQITWHRATQTRRKATQRDESCRENAITSSAGELNSQKAITVPGKKAANLWPDYNIHIQVSRQTQSHLGSMAMRRPKTGSASALCTRGKKLKQVQGQKIAYFTNKYLSIWGHMKALVLPFHMMYGNMIYSKRLQSDRPKR